MSSRLWVTGLGLVSPLGAGIEPTWAALVRGDIAIGPTTLFDVTGQRSRVSAQIAGMSIPLVEEALGRTSRTTSMAMDAVTEAVRWARLEVPRRRVGLVIGGTTGGMFETEDRLALFHAEPGRTDDVDRMMLHPLTATGERLNDAFGPFQRIRTLSSACSSGANAIVVAASWLLSGEVDAVVAGGSDALCRLTVTGFNALGVLDLQPCRPFDVGRRGTTLGEGAAFLVIERAEDARRRGAAPVVELAGWAVGSEGHHITNPSPDGAVVSDLIHRALERANLAPSDIDYVNAHGTGTVASDAVEALALGKALGREIRRIPVSSSKAQIGHTLGAAGAVGATLAALVIQRKVLVPTAGLEHPDPALELVHVPHRGRSVERVRAALSNAFGFGGMDTVLVLAEPTRESRPRAVDASLAPVRLSAVITGVAAMGPWGLARGSDCADLHERSVAAGEVPDFDLSLDPARARRLDKAARLAAVVADCALRDAKAPASGSGLILGTAFGSVDRCAAFLDRAFRAGPRSASPAEFPNLVPSSPVGHVSIYLGMHGPAFATSDLAASGQSAVAQAVQLVASGEAACMVAGSAEPRSDIADRFLSPLFMTGAPRSESVRPDTAAALVIELGTAALARQAPVLARIDQILEWRADGVSELKVLRRPTSGRAEVLLLGVAHQILPDTAWSTCRVVSCDLQAAASDAWGAVAATIATARISCGMTDEALVLTQFSDRGYAIVLSAP